MIEITHTVEETNQRIDEVQRMIATLVDWARNDAQDAFGKDAFGVARDDTRRLYALLDAAAKIEECRR